MYGLRYMHLYQKIHAIDMKRQAQIAYYQVRPDTKEAYILGYPSMSVHSADIQEDDLFHLEYFKKYYYLNEDLQLHFYYLEDYSMESIQNAK